MAREMEREKQEEREIDDGKGGVNVEGLVQGERFSSGLDMGDFNPADGSNTIDPKLHSFLAGPRPSPADIKSLIHDPTFLPTSNPAFASLGPEESGMQMSAWVDGLPGARRMARESEREKQKGRETEEEKGEKNVEGLVRGRRFNFGYDMGEFNLANESEIPENQSANDSNCDEPPRLPPIPPWIQLIAAITTSTTSPHISADTGFKGAHHLTTTAHHPTRKNKS